MQVNMGAEPFFLKQHYKDYLAFLERDSNEGANICNVWVYNFEYELAKISRLLKKYTYVAMVSPLLPADRKIFCSACRPTHSTLIMRIDLEKSVVQDSRTKGGPNYKLRQPINLGCNMEAQL